MDKEPPYETFQFIETSNTDSDISQLLVLQDDGTLLSMNRDIQYITQVQDAKEGVDDVQTCAVFDVSSQQFYVDVDNASNLIVPSEQFALQNPDGNIYSNSFLIQPETSAATEPMETDVNIPTMKPGEVQCESDIALSSKPANNFTEITLTDAQYHLLEQKGWVLLEFSERIFVLDTVGLHDITTDEKLIQKLKTELEDTSQLIEPGQLKAESNQSPTGNVTDELEVEVSAIMENIDNTDSKSMADIQTVSENTEKESYNQNNPAPDIVENLEVEPEDDGNNKKCDSIKIKTKYTFSDIPDKIFLGKTANGKKLYAKITKSKHKELNMKMSSFKKAYEKDTKVDTIDDVQFTNIVQDYLREPPSNIKMSNVIAADSVVTQLMRMPHIKDTVMGHYIIVTKTVIFVSEDGEEKTRRKPITVTGEVKSTDGSLGRFVPTPYMLHNIACRGSSNIEESLATDTAAKITQEFVEFVHIHTTETKIPGQPSVQSINVCNRKLSLDVIQDAKKRHPNPVYACGACAAVFKTQTALSEHLENYCPGMTDPEDTLTIDTDQLTEQTETYYKLDTGKEKWYSCMQCEEKFSKLFNCKKHIQSHIKPVKKLNEGENTEIKEYKCKMCPSKYFHASSLSKHIVKRHIQIHYNISNKHTYKSYKLFYFVL